jgi:hypothetical protein
MRRWSPLLGVAGEVPPVWRGQSVRVIPERAAGPVETGVAFAIERALAHLPVAPSCLAQAFAGQLMLRRRGTSGIVVVGLRRAEGAPAGGAWEAHAWLLGRAGALAGGPAAAGFTATTVFEVPGGLRAAEVDLGDTVPQAGTTGAERTRHGQRRA